MNQFFFILLAALVPAMACAADMGSGQVVIGGGEILRGDFVEQRRLKGFNKPLNSAGYFVVAPKHGIIWGLEKPFPTTTVITPAGLAQTINGASVMHLPTRNMPFMLHLYATLGEVLTGNWTALETDFVVTRSGDAQSWQIKLAPRGAGDPAMPFSAISISGHKFVENVAILKPDGDSDTLSFLNESVSSSPPTDEENRAFDSAPP
ncbi:MAG: outer membrane lipoprotein carrier protein LolA [Methylomonas sp.]|jgi:hypothetical protein